MSEFEVSESRKSKSGEPEFSGSLAHREPQYVLPLGLIVSFLFHAAALGMVRFAVVRLADGAPEVGGPEAVEFVEVGADGRLLPPEKTAVFSPPKSVPESVPNDGEAIVEPEPLEPSPSPVVPSPVVERSPVPSPVPVRSSSPQPVLSPVASAVPKKLISTSPPASPPATAAPKNATPKSSPPPSTPPASTPPVEPTSPSGSPVTSDQKLPTVDPIVPPNRNPGVTQASFGRLEPVPCLKDCVISNDVRLVASPLESVPLLRSGLLPGSVRVRVWASFDRDRGKFLPGSDVVVKAEGLTTVQLEELRGVVGRFVEKCEFRFVATDNVAQPPPVQLEMWMEVKIS